MLRARRPPPFAQRCVRSYAISLEPPVVYPRKAEPRQFNPRKTHLLNEYASLLRSSTSSPLLLLEHRNLSVPALIKLRRDVSAASTQNAPDAPDSIASTAELTIIRSSIFSVALRNIAPLDAQSLEGITKLVQGELAILKLSSLHPPELHAVIRALDRAVPRKSSEDKQNPAKAGGIAENPPTMGRSHKRIKPTPPSHLSLLGAVVAGRLFDVGGIKNVAELPTLNNLHAEIAGLLSSPAIQLAAILEQGRGGSLARALEGLKQGMEEQSEASV